MSGLAESERAAAQCLRAVLERLPAVLDRRLAPAGVTAFEFSLLEALHESTDGRLRLSQLAARTSATLPRLSRVVSGLERRGLVERVACEEDGRATNAVLTPSGADVYADGVPLYETALRESIFDGLAGDGADRLTAVATEILARLDSTSRSA